MTFNSDSETTPNPWFVLVCVVIAIPLNGWVLSILWNWFIPSVFVAAPVLKTGSAIGLSMVHGFMTAKTENTMKTNTEVASRFVIHPIFMLAIGAIIHAIV